MPKRANIARDRLEQFTDGVIVKVVTVMVLELHAPVEAGWRSWHPLLTLAMVYGADAGVGVRSWCRERPLSRMLLEMGSLVESRVRVRVLSFGPWRGLFAAAGEFRELTPGECVGDLLRRLQDEGVLGGAALVTAAVAVNERFASREQILVEGDVVAVLPPVSGGSGGTGGEVVRLTTEPIRSAEVVDELKAGADGALVVFDGVVRDNTRGRRTLHLDYEAYEAMALEGMRALRQGALERFEVREVAIVHRLGRLTVGETSVLIVVASAHRGAAFDACRWVIDTLKKTVPIWKHEQFVDGARWVEGESFPEHLTGPSAVAER